MTNINDKKLVDVTLKTNHKNETIVCGRFGKTKKQVIVSELQQIEPEGDKDKVLNFWQKRIGRKYHEIKCIIEGSKQFKINKSDETNYRNECL